MSGVSVDTGAPSPDQQDLAAIYTGGQNFLARMAAMSDAKAAAEKALADLNVGKLIKSNMDRAAAAAESAEKAEKEAKETLKAAQKQADTMLAEARQQVQAMQDDASQRAAKQLAEAQAAVEEATGYAKKLEQDAQAVYSAAEQDRNAVTKMQATLADEAQKQRLAMEAAASKKAKLEAKIKKLEQVAKALSAGLQEAEE